MPLSNFGMFGGLLRSGQPDYEGWGTLRQCGVRVAIKLNSESEYPAAKEAKEAGPSVEIDSMPIDQWHPDVTLVRGIAARINDLLERETCVLVHCTHGRDRTGLIVGAWRLIYGHWSLDDVETERALYGVTGIVALADHEITECLERIAVSL